MQGPPKRRSFRGAQRSGSPRGPHAQAVAAPARHRDKTSHDQKSPPRRATPYSVLSRRLSSPASPFLTFFMTEREGARATFSRAGPRCAFAGVWCPGRRWLAAPRARLPDSPAAGAGDRRPGRGRPWLSLARKGRAGPCWVAYRGISGACSCARVVCGICQPRDHVWQQQVRTWRSGQ